VEVARAAFRAQASSVLVIEEETGSFVFEAVAGHGEDHLVGTRLPTDTGIAAWVAASGQPVAADDLDSSSFSREAAEQTGYVPKTIVAAPLACDGEVIGVLEVLDRGQGYDELETLNLLGLLAAQAAAGIDLVRRVRRARREAGGATGPASGEVLEQIAARLPGLRAGEADLLAQLLSLTGHPSVRSS
jgi:GAF domain-containing protein